MAAGPRRDSRVFTVVVITLVCLGALPMLLIIALSSAPSIAIVATILAAIPVVPLVLCYLWLDRYEPEPRRLLLMGLLWGAFAATFGALVVQGIGGLFAGVSSNTSLALLAPVTEEASKGLFLLLLLWWRRAELDGILDGIVYAGMIGIGFAFTENILYLGAAYNGTDGLGPGGVAGLTQTFVWRCLFSPFAHPLFTAFTGIGVGIAVSTRNPVVRWVAPIVGYLCAVLAHALWNASTIWGNDGFIFAYFLIMVPAFAGLIWLGVWSRHSERRMLAAALDDAARRGLFPATDIGWVVDLRARRAARAYAKQTAGKPGEDAMRDYQQAAIELGFLHHRYLRGTAPKDYAVRGQDFLARINAIRPGIAFPGQVVPVR
ncbi:MAG TPA: PrsW family intramembrane metalloprotease [Nocardioides sp.]|uniref:PrsW family intramembrane metalloprotease n=1 Tax=uncultured Nocardioides sp. TaxID=198441 RepID=UPI000ECD94BC|nr:PrsW family intramembrane metalloprotease [uncultured Nocardioides sp.]HCB07521.1 PrsW family intramembrane metalloprotease [Nocardioides sp.]HRD62216.1 PrsW family intramembrane metalloprotease [Nocardioides sp.]HRI95213.1 PrsW family intramembrane metalloprotease [Nocardioides sp.]HRK45110.1 PrsW family intramembrane metalloprotease [Nocardioides sp.]